MDLLASRAKWRTLAILALMYAIMLQLGYIVALLGGYQVGIAAIAIVSVIALMVDAYSYWQCDKIVIRITGARVVSASEAPFLHNMIEELCIASGLPKPQIAIVDDPSLNAFATGRDPQHALVAVNTGLLEALDDNELRGVLAHEMSHIYNRDIFVSAVSAVCVRIVSAIANGFIFAGIAALTAPSAPGRKTKEEQDAENGRRAMGLGLLLIGTFLAITFVPALAILQFAISRTRESMADLTGVKFTKDPEALASALRKITGSDIPTYTRAGGTAHMWIAKPQFTGGGLSNWMSSLTSSHPDPATRIATIDAVARGQSVDLALAKQTQSSASIAFAGLLAAALVIIPGYFVGTNPLQVGIVSDYYGTDGDYTDTGNSDGSSDGYYEEEVNPDADGGFGDGTTTDNGDVNPEDATGGLGDGSSDESTDETDAEPDAVGGLG
ncbi:MAG: M48 family metallopeptidase [Actinobacteria bacterium]|nr:M48 family metallopeptidase [Actinomycetota bacterium]